MKDEHNYDSNAADPQEAHHAKDSNELNDNESSDSNGQIANRSSFESNDRNPKRFKHSHRGDDESSSRGGESSQSSNDNDNANNDDDTNRETSDSEDKDTSTSASANDDDSNQDDGTAEEGDDDDDDEEDSEWLRRIITRATELGIPLQYLAHLPGVQQHLQDAEDNDDDLEYPFENSPTSLKDIAEFIKSPNCQSIVILAGAGMSVASGIPDFRSSNGLYATLDADVLTTTNSAQRERIRVDPSYSLDQHLFMENPLPCLEVNRQFVLGVHQKRWKATLAHRFVELLQTQTRKGDATSSPAANAGPTSKLTRLYTQNIDGLEDQCPGLPHSKRIAVHGSMDEAACALCGAQMDMNEFCEKLQRQIKDISGDYDASNDDNSNDGTNQQSPKSSTTPSPPPPTHSTPIRCNRCGAPTVKPNIVLFRSSLPPVFFQKVPEDTEAADLLLIMGTSLGVAPANSLVWRVPRTCMRVLINREPVGWQLGLDWDQRRRHEPPHQERPNRPCRDFFGQGDCESVCLELMKHLGWLEHLRPLLENGELPESSAKLLSRVLEEKDATTQEPETAA